MRCEAIRDSDKSSRASSRRNRAEDRLSSVVHFFLSTRPAFFDAALLILRVFLGVCFVVHGLGKLGIVGPGNMQGFAGWMKSLGLPFDEAQARLAMLRHMVDESMIASVLRGYLAALINVVRKTVAAPIGHKGSAYLVSNNPP